MAMFCPLQILGPDEKASNEFAYLAALETPFSNLMGLNSSESDPQTSLSLCDIAIGMVITVPFRTLMLYKMVSEATLLVMNGIGL